MTAISQSHAESDRQLARLLALLEEFPVYMGCFSLSCALWLINAGYAEIMYLDRIGLVPAGRQKLNELREFCPEYESDGPCRMEMEWTP